MDVNSNGRWFALDPFQVNNQYHGRLFEFLFELRKLATVGILLAVYLTRRSVFGK